MVKTSFGSYEQFKNFFGQAPRNIQNILFKAYPEWARRLTEDYIAATKKISASKVGQEVAKDINKVTGTAPKQIGIVKDTVKGIGEATKATSTASKALGVGGKLVKGGTALASKIAPIQGAVNLFSKDSDVWDRLAGAGMIGTGLAATAGAAAAAPWASALVVGDLLKKNVAEPVGNKLGEMIYGKAPDTSNTYSGLVDVDMPDPMMKQFTPEEENKLRAYNKKVIDDTLAQADASLARGQAEIDAYNNLINGNKEIQNQIENDIRGGSYPETQSGYGIYPQNSQNGQEGGLNINQDNLYLKQYKPSLKSIVEPVNYSNEYLASQNNLINQLYQNANQGEQQQMSMNNPYDLGGLRPYAQIDNPQLAPVPSQQQGLDYGAILNQFNDAMRADQRQNQVNQMINAFGTLGSPSRRAPIYYVGANGKLNAIELDQPD